MACDFVLGLRIGTQCSTHAAQYQVACAQCTHTEPSLDDIFAPKKEYKLPNENAALLL